jgi:hypothetical protein
LTSASEKTFGAGVLSGQSGDRADPRLALPSTVDRGLRAEIESAPTSPALEQVLERHPDQGQLLVPRIEALTIAEIRRDGPGSRFTIEEMTPNDTPGRSVTMEAGSPAVRVLREFPTDDFDGPPDGVPQGGPPSASFGDGSVHRYVGRIPFAPELTIIGDGDKHHRLTFALLAPYGMVYLRGTGRIVLAAAGQQKTIELGR